MLQRVVKAGLKKVCFPIIIVLITVCAALGIVRVFSPSFGISKSLVERTLAKSLHHPVHLKTFLIKWSGLEPTVVVEHARVCDSRDKKLLLELKQLKLKIDVLHSLSQLTLLPSSLSINGAHIKIIQNKQKGWHILGMEAQAWKEHKNSKDLSKLLYWLGTQTDSSISSIDADIIFLHGQTISLTGINLKTNKRESTHNILVSGKIKTSHVAHPFDLRINSRKTGPSTETVVTNFHLNLQHLDLPQQLVQVISPLAKYAIISSVNDLGVELWGEITNSQMQQVKVNLSSNGVSLKNVKAPFAFEIAHLATSAVWIKKTSGWDLSLNNINLKTNQNNSATHSLMLSYREDSKGSSTGLKIDSIFLGDLRSYLKLSPLYNDYLRKWDVGLNVGGKLSEIEFAYNKSENKPHFKLALNFSGLHSLPYKQLPGVTHLNGQVSANESQIKVLVQGHDVQLNYAELLTQPLNLTQFSTQLRLDYSGKKVNSFSAQHTVARNDNVSFSGDIGVKGSRNPVFDIQGQFGVKQVEAFARYTPIKFIPSGLQAWLRQAFIKGCIDQGSVKIHVPLGKGGKAQTKIKLDVSNLGLKYAPEWPVIDGLNATVAFVNKKMRVDAHQVKIKGNVVDSVVAIIPDMSQPVLKIKIDSSIGLQGGINFLQSSPLDVGRAMRDWKGEGKAKLRLNLIEDFETEGQDMHVVGDVTFSNNQVTMMPLTAPFTGVSGQLKIKDENMSAKEISAKLLGQPLSATIATVASGPSGHQLKVGFQGKLDFSKIKEQKLGAMQDKIMGSTDYQGEINVNDVGKGFAGEILVYSDLLGLSSSLPQPFSKLENQSQKFMFDLHFDQTNKLKVQFELAKLLSYKANYQFDNNGLSLVAGNLHLGAGESTQPKLLGLYVDGFLPEFDWDKWSPYFAPYFSSADTDFSTMEFLKDVQLEVRKIKVPHHRFGNTFVTFLQQKDSFNLGVENRHLKGRVKIPKKPNLPWLVNLKKLDLVFKSRGATSFNKAKLELTPNQLPAVKFSCGSCVINHKLIGSVKFEMQKLKRGVRFSSFEISNPDYTLQLKGSWTGYHKRYVTDVYGDFTNYNLGRFLSDWGYSNAIANGFGETMFSLSWLGTPYKVNKASLTGHVAFRYSDGRITKLSHQTESKIGLGRLLNILSLQSLPENVLTGFTRLGKKGFEFDSFKGDISIANGVGHTKNVELEGPVAWVNVNGLIDFSKKRYDLMMQVTPNMTSSLPLIVGIAGGPVAGALTWMANKILAPKIGLVAKKTFHINGKMG